MDYQAQFQQPAFGQRQQQEQKRGLFFVADRREADQTYLEPNSIGMFLSTNEDVFWFVECDSAGNRRVRTCDFKEREDDAPEQYAMKRDIDDVKAMLELMMENANGK